MNFAWKGMMFLGYEMGFWVGMLVTGGITLGACLFAWLIPPQKKKSTIAEAVEAAE